jgi:CubicO group peptidase (beta-lactamase class C family)
MNRLLTRNLAAVLVLCGVCGCTTMRIVRHNFSGIEDHRIFPAREIGRSAEPSPFEIPAPMVRDSLARLFATRITIGGQAADQWLAGNGVVAFLVLQGDTLVYERYFNFYSERSIVPAFSVAKSFVSALVGIAISEGSIEGIEQPLTDFLPELKVNGFDSIRIKHLLQMTSGIKFGESYINPFCDAAKLYYGNDLPGYARGLMFETLPGAVWSYRSIDPQLLGLVLERATGMSPSCYLETRLWKPLGMEFDASWSLDHVGGTEKTFCCLNARARDFARFGLLYLNRGSWEGRRIIPESWIDQSITPVQAGGSAHPYGYLWWLGEDGEGDFYAKGLHGEVIYVNPPLHTVIVMLGKRESGAGPRLFARIARLLRP